jgi:putative two-component system response regulator
VTDARQSEGEPRRGRALIAEHDPVTAELLSEALSLSGLDACCVFAAEDALATLQFDSFELFVADISLPNVRAPELLRRVHKLDPQMAVLLVASSLDVPTAVRCLREGAFDYILKPFDLQDVALRCARAIAQLRERRAQGERQIALERKIEEQNEQILSILQSSLQALAHALEAKDPYTRNHSERVAELSAAIAREMYPDDDEFHKKIHQAALVHDIGKIGISEKALSHPGGLTDDMFREIKRHPAIGESILKPLIPDPEILSAVRNHHERFDGGGYPDGLKGGDIPLSARIVAVADAFDAMVSERPYRRAKSRAEALSTLLQDGGKQWDPDVIAIALKILVPAEVTA